MSNAHRDELNRLWDVETQLELTKVTGMAFLTYIYHAGPPKQELDLLCLAWWEFVYTANEFEVETNDEN